MQDELRCGYTTGACAAAAVKAAFIYAQSGSIPNEVTVKSPQDMDIIIKIAGGYKTDRGVYCKVIKDAGDDPDITHGATIAAELVFGGKDIEVVAGEGVGTVTKSGLGLTVGQPAINSGPRKMIDKVLSEFAAKEVKVILSIPGGAELAKKTLNPILGIEGGLSIIGTTGIVHPMSEEAFKNSLAPQLNVLKANGCETVILTPGKIGSDIALKYGLAPEHIVQTSNFMGFMLDKAAKAGFKKALVWGHIGKLVKLAGGIFHTHSHVADARQEIIAANLALMGADKTLIAKVMNCITTEAIIQVLADTDYTEIYAILADKAARRAEGHVYQEMSIGVVFVNLAGDILAVDATAKKIGEELACHFK